MMGLTERRTHPRADFTGITLIQDGRQEIPCIAGNLSESGILLYPQRRVADPTRAFQVTFTLPSMSEWINLQGRLVREKRMHRRTEWGIEFTDVPDNVQGMLRDYVFDRFDGGSGKPIPLPPTKPDFTWRPTKKTAPQQDAKIEVDVEIDLPVNVEGEHAPSAAFAEELPESSGNLPTQVTLREDLGLEEDSAANDLPTVVAPRADVFSSEGPTRLTKAREAAALRDRCRRN